MMAVSISCHHMLILCAMILNIHAAFAEDTCGLLETTHYHLDVACIGQRKAQSVMHRFKDSTKKECTQACCNWSEGPCDVVYWDQAKTCLIMNYYVIAICPLLTVAVPQSYSPITPLQYVMLRIADDREINIELKKHLKINYQSKIKEILNCRTDDVLCSDWECIDQSKDCNGVDDCSDGSDEICLNVNNTSSRAHCTDKYGNVVFPGNFFERHELSDPCENCRCMSDGSSSCSSLHCAVICPAGRKPGTCCECADGYINGNSYINLSSTQRLVVSCMSVLAVISMLLFFSRNILQRRSTRSGNIVNWMNRREDRYHASLHNSNMETEMQQYSGYGGRHIDLPPPYGLVKPVENSDNISDDIVPPPSYEQVTEESIRLNNQGESEIGGREEEHCEREEEHRQQRQEDEPQSPLSISSDSPLIRQNDI